jgi:FlaA1/EpsC-like NDP-sugar epimerase
MTRAAKARFAFAYSRLAAAAADAAAVAASYMAAFCLRMDFAEPVCGWGRVASSCLVVCAVHLASLFVFGCHALSWRRARVADYPRYIGACALAAAVLTAMRFAMPDPSLSGFRPPYSITPMTFAFASAALIAMRIVWRAFMESRAADASETGRCEATFDNAVAARFFAGRTVAITGAGGSIGSELAVQVAAAGAARILLVERCENALYEIDRRLAMSGCRGKIRPVMADCGDRGRMAALFAAEKPSVVLHAAAYKHVPMVELNPEEGWRNNLEATRSLAETSRDAGVERFVMISTDKAVNPVSVMGKTKLAAEGAVMSMNGGATSFCAVRFGNVFGSSGSVVPLFREQIAARRPVTVTHPDMKRYFMTVREAVSLVLQAASRGERAIYTLDMGEPVRILDLAERMIAKAGYRPYVDIPIEFIGIRPGEKLFEEIDVSERSAFRTDMAKIYVTKAGGTGCS